MVVIHIVVNRYQNDNHLHAEFVLPPAMAEATSATHQLGALN